MNVSRETVSDRYEEMWRNALPRIHGGNVELDPVLRSGRPDTRRGLTLIARPSHEVQSAVSTWVETIRGLEPDQHYYAKDELHLTVLSLFTAAEDHGSHFSRLADYRDAAREAIEAASAFTLNFRGITASPSAVLLQGFPGGNALETIRGKLRTALKDRGFGNAADARYRLVTAHMTALRFRAPLLNPARFARRLEESRGLEFGEMVVAELQLISGDWYMSSGSQRQVASWMLAAGRAG